jgi:hypothetical protein
MLTSPRAALAVVALIGAAACSSERTPSYLFVWAGDSANRASDFLAVIDATPSSPRYGSIVTSIPTGAVGTHPHHTEAEMPADGHLLANGFHAGRTWLFDLTQPTQPKVLGSFGDLAGFSHPHTFVRESSGNVLATFQYASSSAPMQSGMAGNMHDDRGSAVRTSQTTGGLVEMDERGSVLRSASARDTTIGYSKIFPYSVLPVPALDRAISTTTDMDDSDSSATSEWIQLWRLSDLKLLKSIALPPGPRKNENQLTGEPRLLPDGRSVYIQTFNCGLYLLRDLAGTPTARLVHTFQGINCGVPIVAGHNWLQTVPEAHALVALDITDPANPHEVSSVTFGSGEAPHWIAIDRTGRRVVLNSGGNSKANRLYMINFDPSNGALRMDEKFRDPDGIGPGVSMIGKTWPHGFTGTAVPHGTVFSR